MPKRIKKSAKFAGKSPEAERIFSVAEYIEFLNIFFKNRSDRIRGEISQCKVYGSSGHVYFTIKDKSGQAVLDCIMWGRTYELCGVKLETGMEVIVSGHPNIYAARGSLSLICDTVELVGEGALKIAYDELKKKLEAEGAFLPERKRPIPEFAERIGVVTSRDGAVIHDFVNNLGRFGLKVFLADSRVEGQAALRDLRSAIRAMRKQKIGVLVVIRGGGSLESLQAFNNEVLVREVLDFPVPVIAGIGHDKDVPLFSLAADAMTSTPTAAAHLVNRSWEEAYMKIREAARIFTRVEGEFPRIHADLDAAWNSVLDHTEDGIRHTKEMLAHAEQAVKSNNPERQLKLGYAIVRSGGKILRSAKEAKPRDKLETQLRDGVVRSRVEGQGLF